MPPTSMMAKLNARCSAPSNPAFDSAAAFKCKISLDIFATATSALGIVKPPIVSSFASARLMCSTRPSPASAARRVPEAPIPAWVAVFVHHCRARTGVYDKSGGMAVERACYIEVIARVQPHRYAGEASPGKKAGQFFADHRTWPVRIDVKHLPCAIDNHSKFAHLTRAEKTI